MTEQRITPGDSSSRSHSSVFVCDKFMRFESGMISAGSRMTMSSAELFISFLESVGGYSLRCACVNTHALDAADDDDDPLP